MTLKQLGEKLHETVDRMSPEDKASVRRMLNERFGGQMNQSKRSRRKKSEPAQPDAVESLLQRAGVPVTRETYLNAAYLGKPPKNVTYEQEQELPELLRRPEEAFETPALTAQPHCPEENKLFDAILCEPLEFVRDVADHLCAMPRFIFTEDVIQASTEVVADAYDQLVAERPAVARWVFGWKAWKRDGVRVN